MRAVLARMTEIAVRNDRLVAARVVVIDGVLDEGAGVADVALTTHPGRLCRPAVRTKVAGRAVVALADRSHVGSANIIGMYVCMYV